jgi:hypothetical protein
LVAGLSRGRFQAGMHYVRYPADLGGVPEFVGGRFSLPETVAGSLNCHVDADLVSILETVGHGLDGRVNSNGHSFYDVFLHARRQGDTGKKDDPQRWIIDSWEAGSYIDGQPDLKPCLRRQPMKLERGEQADNAAPDTAARFDQ